MISLLKDKLQKHNFAQNVLMLISGTTISQAIPILISPILTRIYPPEDFGIFAFYLSIISVLSIFTSGRYELAIMLPRKHEEAYNILALIFILSVSVSIICMIAVLIFNDFISNLLGKPEISPTLYIIPASILIVGFLKAYTYWFNRNKAYKAIMTNRVIQSSSTAFASIGFGWFGLGAIGLVIGYIAGQAAGVLTFFTKNRVLSDYKVSNKAIVRQAKKYNRFPKFLTFAHGIEATSSNLPNILFTTFFSTTIAGYYMLVVRTISLPLSIIATAIGDVFLQKASAIYSEKGSCQGLFLKTSLSLIMISIIPFLILFVSSEHLFVIVFGEEWRQAGVYAKILIIPCFFQFISSPLSHMFVIAQKQKLELLLQIFILILVSTSLLVGHFAFNSVTASVKLLAISLSLKYSLMYIISYFFSKGSNNKVSYEDR